MKTKIELFVYSVLTFYLLFYPSDSSFNHQISQNTYQNNGYAFWYLHVVYSGCFPFVFYCWLDITSVKRVQKDQFHYLNIFFEIVYEYEYFWLLSNPLIKENNSIEYFESILFKIWYTKQERKQSYLFVVSWFRTM